MRYVALLRGINVGGNNIIKMTDLAACLETAGCRHARTCIASGNVIFDSPQRNIAALIARVETAIAATFGVSSRVVVVSRGQLQTVLAGMPAGWQRRTDIRRNIAFLRPPLTAVQAMADVEVQPGVDVVTAGRGVLYMSTVLKSAARSRLTRLVGKPAYREMTIRTSGTCEKILALMDQPLP
jgi:uncharacterized protein (DUF1697 family)